MYMHPCVMYHYRVYCIAFVYPTMKPFMILTSPNSAMFTTSTYYVELFVKFTQLVVFTG